MSNTPRPRVLSGIQATGKLHIGNYIGAISLWAENQESYENYLFVADLHALTIPEAVKPTELRARVEEIFALYIACGIDPERSTLFVQSEVPQHAQLGWLMTCVTPVSWLERSTQIKTKTSAERSFGAGLLCYPSLQAADILLYDPDAVPVGEDQRQHVEMTRDMARRFNDLFGPTFKIPEALMRKSGARIMGLDDPTAKMSKSTGEISPGHAIGLLDPPAKVKKAIMRAVTDSGSAVNFEDDLAPGVENLLTIYEVMTKTTRANSENEFADSGYGKLKTAVAEAVNDRLEQLQDTHRQLMQDRSYLEKLLRQGSEQARAIAEPKLASAYKAVGLR